MINHILQNEYIKMFITTPYETSTLHRLNMEKTYKRLREMLVVNQLYPIDEPGKFDYDTFSIVGLHGQYDDIPYFYQPVTILLTGRVPTFVIDLRPYQGCMVKDGVIFRQPGNETVNQLLVHAIAIGYFRKDPQAFLASQDIPINTYGSLIAETLSRRLGLDPSSTLKVMCAFQIFYMTRAVMDIRNIKEDELLLIATALSRKMKVDLNTHLDIAKQFTGEDFESLLTFVKKITQLNWSPRLTKLSPAELIILLSGGWVGQGNPKETMAVALEFPPCWISLNFICARSKFYQKLPLGQILKRLDRNGTLNNFTNSAMMNYFGPVFA